VSTLHLGDAVHVRELVLPEGVTLAADPDLLLVHVTSRAAAAEPEAGEGETSVQPVVIKPERKEKEE
jgi:large subunit ribosomal protein L25